MNTGYPSIDKPWQKYYPDGFPSVPKCTIWRNIYDNNKAYDGKVHYCFDVEDVILTQDGVDQCEVVAIPNSAGYDDLHCFVVKEAKSAISDSALVDGLRTYCREVLPAGEVPKSFRVLSKFPIKPSGKRDMEALRKLAGEYFSVQ